MRHLTDQLVRDIVAQYQHGTDIKTLSIAFNVPVKTIRRLLIAEAYYYGRMWWNTGTSLFSIFTQLIERGIAVGTLVLVSGNKRYAFLAVIGVVGYEVIKFLAGMLYFRHGFAAREQEVANQYNPQLWSIYHGVHNFEDKTKKVKIKK